MKVTRYVNEKKLQGALPPVVIENKAVLAIYRQHLHSPKPPLEEAVPAFVPRKREV